MTVTKVQVKLPYRDTGVFSPVTVKILASKRSAGSATLRSKQMLFQQNVATAEVNYGGLFDS